MKILKTSPKSELKAIFIYFIMFPYTFLPSITPLKITFKLFSNKIISLASFAISVAVFTHIPTSALCSDGASFTPSPIYPTTCPFFFKVFIILSFCNGFILANTLTSSTSFANSSSVILSTSAPIRTFLFSIPTKLHIFSVVYWLSPVKIFVVTPYSFNFFIVPLTSFFGGSKNATNPINTISLSSNSLNTFFPEYSLLDANAITCIPCFASFCAFVFMFSINSCVNGSCWLLILTVVQLFSTSSNAPFVIIL